MINNFISIPSHGDVFVGLKIENNRIQFHYPDTYNLSEDENMLRRDILSILHTISLSKSLTKEKDSYNSNLSDDYEFPISAYLWIINDYLTYGRYENKEKVYCSGIKGKINWKRTLISMPIISGGNIIYSDFVSERKSQIDNLITHIYLFCAKRSVDSLGWLFGLEFDSNGIDYEGLFDKERYLIAINTELAHSFDEIKRTRLQNMKNIITGLDSDTVHNSDITYGVDKYDYVYERMVDKLFSTVGDIQDFYPSASWHLVLNNRQVPSSNLRPDTVMIVGRDVYILDAKYYRYGITFDPDSLPNTGSIQKQITYGEYVKRKNSGEYDNVYSAFIMPYSKSNNKHRNLFHENVEFIGMGKPNWIESNEHTQRKIAAILIDMTYLIKHWPSRTRNDLLHLSNLIKEKVEEDKT